MKINLGERLYDIKNGVVYHKLYCGDCTSGYYYIIDTRCESFNIDSNDAIICQLSFFECNLIRRLLTRKIRRLYYEGFGNISIG
jgi:hypothetical protein